MFSPAVKSVSAPISVCQAVEYYPADEFCIAQVIETKSEKSIKPKKANTEKKHAKMRYDIPTVKHLTRDCEYVETIKQAGTTYIVKNGRISGYVTATNRSRMRIEKKDQAKIEVIHSMFA
jgi:hypothetical protein